MTNDLLKRLRSAFLDGTSDAEVMREGADEIERLREALESIMEDVESGSGPWLTAHDALNGRPSHEPSAAQLQELADYERELEDPKARIGSPSRERPLRTPSEKSSEPRFCPNCASEPCTCAP